MSLMTYASVEALDTSATHFAVVLSLLNHLKHLTT